MADVLQRTGHGVCAPDAEAVQAALERLASGSLIAPSWPSADLQGFTWAARSRQLVDVFESCLARRSREGRCELMCGIVGVWNLDGEPVDVGRLVAATRTLRHRGPDDEGFVLIDSRTGRHVACKGSETSPAVEPPRIEDVARRPYDLAFGHRRLAILDLSVAGHQPLVDASTGDALVFNGEIYNHRDWAGELSGAGEVLTSRCDTEVLFKGLQPVGYGGDAPAPGRDVRVRVLGCARPDAALARAIVSARSRSSTHHRPGETFVFASEMKALFPFVGVPGVERACVGRLPGSRQRSRGDEDVLRVVQPHPARASPRRSDRDGVHIERYWDVDLDATGSLGRTASSSASSGSDSSIR